MFIVLERACNTLQLSAHDEPNRYLSVIENQLERCLEQPLVLRAEYDAHPALRTRLDVVKVSLEDYFEARGTMNKTELYSGKDLLSIAPICCLGSSLYEFYSRKIILGFDSD